MYECIGEQLAQGYILDYRLKQLGLEPPTFHSVDALLSLLNYS